MLRKFFSAILAVVLVLLPMASLAEGETMFTQLKITDPKVTIMGMDEIDMTGLEIVLTGAYDVTDSDNPVATITAQMLANGVEALGAAVGVDKEKAVGVLNGLQNVYGIKLEDAVPGYVFDAAMVEEFIQAVNTPVDEDALADEEFAKEIEALLHMEEKGEEEIEFRGEKVNATVYTMTITAEECEELVVKVYSKLGIDEETIKAIWTEANAEVAGEFTIYEVDENRVYIEGVYTTKQKTNPVEKFIAGATNSATSAPEEVQVYMTASVVAIDDANVDMHMEVDAQPTDGSEENVKAIMDMVVKSSDAFEDAASANMTMIMTVSDPAVTETVTMTFNMEPQAIEEGWNYDYDFDMNVPGEVHMNISGKSMVGKEDMLFTIDVVDLLQESGDLFSMSVEGKYAETEETYHFEGNLSLAGNMEGMLMSFSTKVAIDADTSVEGQMLPMEGMNAIDIQTMTEGELEALNGEAMGLMFGVVDKLMQIPGLKPVIEAGLAGMIDTNSMLVEEAS